MIYKIWWHVKCSLFFYFCLNVKILHSTCITMYYSSLIYQQGCYDAAVKFFEDKLLIIGGVSLGIAFFQVTIEKNIFQHTPGGVKTQYMHCWAENQNLVFTCHILWYTSYWNNLLKLVYHLIHYTSRNETDRFET